MSPTALPAIHAAWRTYRTCLAREVQARADLRTAISDALADGTSQSDIARELDVPRQYIHRLMRREREAQP